MLAVFTSFWYVKIGYLEYSLFKLTVTQGGAFAIFFIKTFNTRPPETRT